MPELRKTLERVIDREHQVSAMFPLKAIDPK
jgi:hypothetical protein